MPRNGYSRLRWYRYWRSEGWPPSVAWRLAKLRRLVLDRGKPGGQ